MTASAENIKLAIQAAWAVNEPAFALTLALREHSLRGLCLQCAGNYRRLLQGRDAPRNTVLLVCRQCYRSRTQTQPIRRAGGVPTFTASVYTPPALARDDALNSIWLDTTNLRAYVRRRLIGWSPSPEGDELFELLGVEPEQIYQVMSSYASTAEYEGL